VADPVQYTGLGGACFERETDEEACICDSADRVTCMGPNQTDTQERDRARRQLCANRPHSRRQTDLLDEVRKFAGTTATASSG
jgi:hypothetical protein